MEVTSPPEPSTSVNCAKCCRICYDSEKDEVLIAPCHCKGSVAFVHPNCLKRWYLESNCKECELCHVAFQKDYLLTWSLQQYIEISRSLRCPGAIIICTFITPFVVIFTYMCLFIFDHDKEDLLVPAARWAAIFLLIIIGLLLIGYYLWVYSITRMQARLWQSQQLQENVVQYVPTTTTVINENSPSRLIPLSPGVNTDENDENVQQTDKIESNENSIGQISSESS